MTTDWKDEKPGLFSKHDRAAYRDDAANPAYPNPSRVSFLAYGTHRANGHARFEAQEIAKVLGAYDEHGTFVPATKYAVRRAIDTAIKWGLLAPGSKALCLIVPGHRIEGHIGDPNAPCDRHRKVKGAATRTLSRPKGAESRAVSSPKGAGSRTLSSPKGAGSRTVSRSIPFSSDLSSPGPSGPDTTANRRTA